MAKVTARERDAYWGGLRARTNEPAAPVAWPLELVLLAGETAIEAFARDQHADHMFAGVVSLSIQKVRTDLERRRASALRLSAEAAPQVRFGWEWPVLQLACGVCLRLGGIKPAAPTWSEAFARALIGELDRRRAWRRALSGSPG
jgi:hypothetical protein